MMKSQVSHLQDTPFYVDQHRMKVFVDLGNSLPIYENGSIATNIFDGLLVALPLNENPSLTCSDDLLWLGMVYDKYPHWYENSAGIQIFPALGSLSDNEMKTLSNHPLVVAEVHDQYASFYLIYKFFFHKIAQKRLQIIIKHIVTLSKYGHGIVHSVFVVYTNCYLVINPIPCFG